MGSIEEVKAAAEKILRNAGRIHGSAFRELLVQKGAPGYADSWGVEGIINTMGLVPECPDKPDPTFSQRAFFSLQCFKKHPGFVPGTKEHFWLVRGERAPAPAAAAAAAVPAPAPRQQGSVCPWRIECKKGRQWVWDGNIYPTGEIALEHHKVGTIRLKNVDDGTIIGPIALTSKTKNRKIET